MKKITQSQMRQLFMLFPARIKQDKEVRKEFIYNITQDPERTSTKDLTMQEANMIIDEFSDDKKRYAYFDKHNKQHMILISLARQVGWLSTKEDGTVVACLERLGGWIKKYGHLHKPMKDYNPSQLSKLIFQFEKTVVSQLAG